MTQVKLVRNVPACQERTTLFPGKRSLMSDLARHAAAVRTCSNRRSCSQENEQLTSSFLRREVARVSFTDDNLPLHESQTP